MARPRLQLKWRLELKNWWISVTHQASLLLIHYFCSVVLLEVRLMSGLFCFVMSRGEDQSLEGLGIQKA